MTRRDTTTSGYQQICNLLFRYGELIDDGDFEGIAGMFAKARIITPNGNIEGHDGVLAMYRNSTRLYPDGTPCTQHVISNQIIDIDGNSASARSRFTVLQQTATLSLQVIISGRYHDRFACNDGHWFFVEREMKAELFGDLSQHLLFDAGKLK